MWRIYAKETSDDDLAVKLTDDADLAAEAGEPREFLEEREFHAVEASAQTMLAGEEPYH